MVLTSCKKTSPDIPTPSTNLNQSFTSTSTGSIQIQSMTENHIYLSGSVKVDTGQVEVILLTPDGFNIYDNTFPAGKPVSIYIEFGTMYGFWTLKYKSIQGTGNVNLTLTY